MSLMVLGTDTDVGKTVVSSLMVVNAALADPGGGRGEIRKTPGPAGKARVGYWKPVATGGQDGRDTGFVRRVCHGRGGVTIPDEAYLLDAPTSPHAAAAGEGRSIDIGLIVKRWRQHLARHPGAGWVVEGLGGVMVPLDQHGTLLVDLVARLDLACLVVARAGLGTLNHTLLTLEALRNRGLTVAGLVLNGPFHAANRDALVKWGDVDLVLQVPPIPVLTAESLQAAARRVDPKGRLSALVLDQPDRPGEPAAGVAEGVWIDRAASPRAMMQGGARRGGRRASGLDASGTLPASLQATGGIARSAAGDPDWLQADLQHVWHPYTQMLTAPAPLPVERAEGVYLFTSDGRRILDGISSWWVNIHGHNHPRLNRAVARQSERLAQVIFAGFTHEPAARLAAALAARAPGSMPHVFYSDDGSTAVEVALKMAYQSWRNRGETHRTLFVALENAYHGDTFGSMAVAEATVFNREFSDLFFEVLRVPTPPVRGCGQGTDHLACTAALERLLETRGDRIAAIIIEPMVQAAGGMILWPAGFLRQIRALTAAHRIPLIADEVFTGFGRTGPLFACQHGPIAPDILCLSKALTGGYLPLAATLCTDEIYQAFLSEDRGKTFFHGHSYTANALACAVALESLDLLEGPQGLARVARLTPLFQERLEKLNRLDVVSSVRCIGGLAALDLVPGSSGDYLDRLGPTLAAGFLERGVLLRPLGNVLYFLPPYVITDDEAHQVFDLMDELLAGL
ncbi:MAG: adenosylmethionine--8-amino-7-oxononanoate transaminase [Acidobacteriota bacterium]